MRRPPSREQWLIDSELHGHSVEQVIRYLSDCDDYAAEQAERRAAPVGVITFDAEPRIVTWWRRRRGR
jgi:hypothetical protein